MLQKASFMHLMILTFNCHFLLCFCNFEEFWNEFLLSEDLLVQSPVGDIEGIKETTSSGDRYVAFRGIPYAKPPIGKLRFDFPQPTVLGDGIFKAHSNPKMCPQSKMFRPNLQTSEDCLYLNIFTKDLKKSHKLKKVLLYIHGGSFIVGSALENDAGSIAVHQDIIVVVINYRLGILGFLSTGNNVSPGNYGLWDQLMAIKWVKHNIRSFGGDENDITIAGESAGGGSVTYLSLSPFGKNLFTKVYAQSGTASWTALTSDTLPVQDTLALAKSNKCWDGRSDLVKLTIPESQSVIKCLRKIDLNDSISNQEPSLFARFSVVIDGVLIPRAPMVLLKSSKYLKQIGFYDRSYLIGFNNNERAFIDVTIRLASVYSNMTNEDIYKISRLGFQLNVNERLGQPKSKTVFADNVFNWYNKRVTTPVTDAVDDLLFTIPSFDFLNAASRCHKGNGWLLFFNYYPALMKGPYRGMPHEADLYYWQDKGNFSLYGAQGGYDEDDVQIREMLQSLIGTFVKTGNPSSSKLKLANDWPKYSKQGGEYLDFNIRPSVRSHLKQDKTKYWLHEFPKFVKSQLTN